MMDTKAYRIKIQRRVNDSPCWIQQITEQKLKEEVMTLHAGYNRSQNKNSKKS